MEKKKVINLLIDIVIFVLVVVLTIGWHNASVSNEENAARADMYRNEVMRRVFDTTGIHGLGSEAGVTRILEAELNDMDGEWFTLTDSEGKSWVVEDLEEGERYLIFVSDNGTEEKDDDYVSKVYLEVK